MKICKMSGSAISKSPTEGSVDQLEVLEISRKPGRSISKSPAGIQALVVDHHRSVQCACRCQVIHILYNTRNEKEFMQHRTRCKQYISILPPHTVLMDTTLGCTATALRDGFVHGGCHGPCAPYTLSALDPPYPASIRARKNSRKNRQKAAAAPRALFQLLAPRHITHRHSRPTAQTSRHFRESVCCRVINPPCTKL